MPPVPNELKNIYSSSKHSIDDSSENAVPFVIDWNLITDIEMFFGLYETKLNQFFEVNSFNELF